MKTEGYPVKEYKHPVKRYCQFLELSDDSELLKAYKDCHSPEKHWKCVREGIHEVGILEMEIYIFGNKVVMIVEAGLDFDWEESMAKLATLPGQAEWEAFVAEAQGCDPNLTSDQKWQMMERFFYLYD